jgi:serpin B
VSFRNWEQWMTQFRPTQGNMKLPRFKLEYNKELNDALKALGMDVAFAAGQADFTAMHGAGDLFISRVKHKTVVEVNEEGTAAAAATSVIMSRTAAIPAEPFTFVADHPFFVAIREAQTGAVLFMGVIAEPK